MSQEQALFADQLVQLPYFEELVVQVGMEESVGEQQLHPDVLQQLLHPPLEAPLFLKQLARLPLLSLLSTPSLKGH